MAQWPPGGGKGMPPWHVGLECDLQLEEGWMQAKVTAVEAERVKLRPVAGPGAGRGRKKEHWLDKSSDRVRQPCGFCAQLQRGLSRC